MSTDHAIIERITLNNVGPTDSSEALFAPRLNIITGDNGIGKTFLMNCVWYALTATWADRIAMPKYQSNDVRTSIGYSIQAEGKSFSEEIIFDKTQGLWQRDIATAVMNGAAVYSLVDNTYALWDSTEKTLRFGDTARIVSSKQIWEGGEGFPDGLISDWLKWQAEQDKYPFEVFKNILCAVSPPDTGKLYPGEPIPMPDGKPSPTIIFPYATVPISYASAGIKRAITLAYIIVKAWLRHTELCGNGNTSLAVLIDEIEAHIHPKWQRTILSALIEIQKSLYPAVDLQFIISTHSPLILASAEVVFDSELDKLFKVRLSDSKTDAIVQEEDFIKYGQINAWLTSPLFDLTHARSVEAEKAIEYAKQLQLEDTPDANEVKKAHEALTKYLAQTDPFWPRWIYFAEQNGVEV